MQNTQQNNKQIAKNTLLFNFSILLLMEVALNGGANGIIEGVF